MSASVLKSALPSPLLSSNPSVVSTLLPSSEQSSSPTTTALPSNLLTAFPSSLMPSLFVTSLPSSCPTSKQTFIPSQIQSGSPSSNKPSLTPTSLMASLIPSSLPSIYPSYTIPTALQCTNNLPTSPEVVDIPVVVNNFAGVCGKSGYTGYPGPATSAKFNLAIGVASDGNGNAYITDQASNYIRLVSTSGIISAFAGLGSANAVYIVNGNQSTATSISGPNGIFVDSCGNVFFSDPGFHIIHKISTDGIVSVIAGTPQQGGYSGIGGQATSTLLGSPNSINMDPKANIYVSDTSNNVISKISTSGIIHWCLYGYLCILQFKLQQSLFVVH